jgi:hypothetical protein
VLRDALKSGQNFCGVKRLVHEIGGTQPEDFVAGAGLDICRGDNHVCVRVEGPESCEGFNSIHPFHDNVEEDSMRFAKGVLFEGFETGTGLVYDVAGTAKDFAQLSASESGIVDNKDTPLDSRLHR